MIAVANAEMQSLVKLSKDLANQNGYLAKELKSLQDVAQKKPNVEEQTGLLRAEVRELEHELRQRNQENLFCRKKYQEMVSELGDLRHAARADRETSSASSFPSASTSSRSTASKVKESGGKAVSQALSVFACSKARVMQSYFGQ